MTQRQPQDKDGKTPYVWWDFIIILLYFRLPHITVLRLQRSYFASDIILDIIHRSGTSAYGRLVAHLSESRSFVHLKAFPEQPRSEAPPVAYSFGAAGPSSI